MNVEVVDYQYPPALRSEHYVVLALPGRFDLIDQHQ
jgi:hypothetical protein